MKRENFIEIPLKDQLLKKIQSYIKTIWFSKVDQNKIDGWLSNFKNTDSNKEEREKLNMLYLLSKFSYLGEKEVRVLLKSLYRDLFKRPIIYEIRKKLNDTLIIETINREFKKEFKRTKFVAVGGVSESGASLMMPFRQENSIPEGKIIGQDNIFQNVINNGKIEKTIKDISTLRYIFIDDFIGSGIQGKEKLKNDIKLLKENNKNIEINYYVLVATENGLKALRELNHFDSVEAVFTLDDTFKVFDVNSRYYTTTHSEIDLNFSKEIATRNGRTLVKKEEHILGFGDCQLLLGFSHNTPNNTLPVFWGEKNKWKHIFKRFAKIKK